MISSGWKSASALTPRRRSSVDDGSRLLWNCAGLSLLVLVLSWSSGWVLVCGWGALLGFQLLMCAGPVLILRLYKFTPLP